MHLLDQWRSRDLNYQRVDHLNKKHEQPVKMMNRMENYLIGLPRVSFEPKSFEPNVLFTGEGIDIHCSRHPKKQEV